MLPGITIGELRKPFVAKSQIQWTETYSVVQFLIVLVSFLMLITQYIRIAYIFIFNHIYV